MAAGRSAFAYTEDEMDWFRHTLAVGRSLGFPIELVEPDRVRELHPFYNLDGVLGALHTPKDGHVDPARRHHGHGCRRAGPRRARLPSLPGHPHHTVGRRRSGRS